MTSGRDKSKPSAGRDVLNRMVAAYRKASSYSDAGTVHLLAEAGNEKVIDQTSNFSVSAGAAEQAAGSGLSGNVGLRRPKDPRRHRGHSEPGGGQTGAGQGRHEGVPHRSQRGDGDRRLCRAAAAIAAVAGRRPDERPAPRRRGAGAARAGPDRRARLLQGANHPARRRSRVLDRPADVGPAPHRISNRPSVAQAKAGQATSRSTKCRWWPSSPARSLNGKVDPKAFEFQMPQKAGDGEDSRAAAHGAIARASPCPTSSCPTSTASRSRPSRSPERWSCSTSGPRGADRAG